MMYLDQITFESCHRYIIYIYEIIIKNNNIFKIFLFQIKNSLNKSNKSLKKQTVNINSYSNTTISKFDTKNISKFLIDNEHQEQFAKFLNERRKEQRKKNKKKYFKLNDIYNFEEQNINNNDKIENNCDDFAENDYDIFDECDNSIHEEFKKKR